MGDKTYCFRTSQEYSMQQKNACSSSSSTEKIFRNVSVGKTSEDIDRNTIVHNLPLFPQKLGQRSPRIKINNEHQKHHRVHPDFLEIMIKSHIIMQTTDTYIERVRILQNQGIVKQIQGSLGQKQKHVKNRYSFKYDILRSPGKNKANNHICGLQRLHF
ncbi:hypothetical protein QYE76_001506 [Lolium multiflorum]|uniref:Uncharacterized protein n=1 Tax=Lolium multiflorum TaxID=4521 RepID=A0AAD8RNX4_LOLMU|nr:hypothetical protein QYE76_001506 [Lolium multiflorum]